MIEDELIQLWQTSPLQEQIKFEKSRLMLDVQSSLTRLERRIKYRDFIEIGVAVLIVIPLFIYQAYIQPNYLSKLGALWIVVYCFYVIYRLVKSKKKKPVSDCSYVEHLRQNKTHLIEQKILLNSVLYWYVLPCLVGFVIMLVGLLDLPNKTLEEIIKIDKVWIGFFACIAAVVIIPLMNKRAVKKEIVPRIKKVNELIRLMLEG